MKNRKDIPMMDLGGQYKLLKKDVQKRWNKLCDSSSFILGREVEEFEERFARYCGTKYAIGVSSGTSALHLALLALGCKGKRVITTPLTFIATSEAVIHAGAKIKWVDIEDRYYNIDPDNIVSANPSESEIILPVHLYGHPADMSAITSIAEQNNLKVVEDCAQAHGAEYSSKKVGSFGDIGCFSFYPGKNLGAYGEAGCVVCNDRETAELLMRLRAHGSSDKYFHTELGYNYRIDALQAAVLNVKLKYLDEWNESRIENARLYSEELKGSPVKVPEVAEGAKHVFHQYVLLAPKRDHLISSLRDRGIASAVHYPIPLHLQPVFSFMGYKGGDFPVAEKVASQCFSPPMYPELKASDIKYIAENIRKFYA